MQLSPLFCFVPDDNGAAVGGLNGVWCLLLLKI